MLKISSCPECSQKVTIPEAADGSELVRCPLCDGEFLLAEVIPGAALSPPELVRLKPAGQTAVAAVPQNETATPAAGTEGAADTAALADAKEPAADEPSLKLWEDVSDAPQIDIGQADKPADAGGFEFGGIETGEEDEQPTGAPPSALRRRKNEKSFARELVGIVLGGAAGLLLAYYGLNLFGGPRFDFAEVYLPGIAHTAKHRPSWWPGWLTFESTPEEAFEDDLDIDEQLQNLDELKIPQTPASATAGVAGSSAEAGRNGNHPHQRRGSAGGRGAATEPAVLPGSLVSLVNPPRFKPDELGAALKAASNVFGCPRCNSTGEVTENGKKVPCPDCQGHPPDAMTPAAYPAFCRLAEVIAFVEPAPGGQMPARTRAATELLRTVGAKPENVVEIGRLAASHLDQEDRPSSGILLAGTVRATGKRGEFNSATIKLAGVERRITLADKRPLGLVDGDRVLVLGSLVADPRSESEPIKHDAAASLVWRGLCVKFEN